MSYEVTPDSPAEVQPVSPIAAQRPKGQAGPWVGFGLVIGGFALALIPLVGVIGWPLMLAALILGIIGAAKKWQPMWANIVNIVLGFAGPGLAIVLVTGALAAGPAVSGALEGEESSGQGAAEVAGEPNDGEQPADATEGTQSDFAVAINGSQPGTDYSGAAVLVVDYTFTNNSDKAVSFMFAVQAKAFQDGVELERAIGADIASEDQLKEIKPGAAIELQVGYVLSGSSDVTVEVTELVSFTDEIIATEVFSVQ